MRSVQAAEDAMPIGVIALRTKKLVARLEKLIGSFRTAMSHGNCGDARGDAQHFLVEQIRLRVFAEETAPGTAAEKREDLGSRGELFLDCVVALADTRGQ